MTPRKSLGFMQLTILCGFSMYYAWYLISFFGFFMFIPAGYDFASMHSGQVVFFFGCIATAAALLAWFRKADGAAIGHARFLYLADLIPGLFLPALMLASYMGCEIPATAFYAACLLCGASVAIGFTLWEDVTSHGRLNKGVLAHGTVFCAGGIVFVVSVLFLPGIQICIVGAALLCASMALLAFITQRCDIPEGKPVEPARQYFRKTWHIDAVITLTNVAFGYAFMLLYQSGSNRLIGAACIAIFVDLAYSIAFGRGKWVQYAGWARICTAFVSCALLLLICPQETLRTAALCVIVVFWFLFRTMNGGSLADLANYNDYSMLYSATRGKMPANAGFMLGLAVGITAIAVDDPDVVYLYIPLALVAAFIFAALFFLPFGSRSMDPGYKALTPVNMHESPESGLRGACRIVTEQFGLSPRESEVLAYIVRGRNARHVSEKLFISESTAKTHISNIYHKVGVHSQQELLDKLDELA